MLLIITPAMFDWTIALEKVEPEVLCDEQTQCFPIRQLNGLSRATTDEVSLLVRDIDAAFLRDGAGDKVVRVE